MSQKTEDLDERIIRFIREGIVSVRDESQFNELALKVFEYQYNNCPAYKALCDRRGINPGSISSWQDIPAIPTALYKKPLLSPISREEAVKEWHSSGTTGKDPSVVFIDKGQLRIYEAEVETTSNQFFWGLDGYTGKFLVIQFTGSPEMMPHKNIVYGMSHMMKLHGTEDSFFAVSPQGMELEKVIGALEESIGKGEPVAIIGASFAIVQFMEICKRKGITFNLPQHSRVLDAGGYKGKTRELTSDEYRSMVQEVFNVNPKLIVNTLGMTELNSQFYDASIPAGDDKRVRPILPWTKVQVVDPSTLSELPDGQVGLLRYLDISNRSLPMALLTDDLGVKDGNYFNIVGRVKGSETKGCSIAMETPR